METASRPERLGVFGGTFDPPHVGHIAAAVNVRDALGLDRVVFVVANDPWQKRGTRSISAAADRLAMVEAAVAGRPGLEADAREIRRSGPSFTADTLAELGRESPGRALFLILGSDAAAGLATWQQPEAVAAQATIAVVPRGAEPGSEPTSVDPDALAAFRWVAVGAPVVDLSSTGVRARISGGEPIDGLVPDGVASLLRSRRLYPLPR